MTKHLQGLNPDHFRERIRTISCVHGCLFPNSNTATGLLLLLGAGAGQQHDLELSLRPQQGRIRVAEEAWPTVMQSLLTSTPPQSKDPHMF